MIEKQLFFIKVFFCANLVKHKKRYTFGIAAIILIYRIMVTHYLHHTMNGTKTKKKRMVELLFFPPPPPPPIKRAMNELISCMYTKMVCLKNITRLAKKQSLIQLYQWKNKSIMQPWKKKRSLVIETVKGLVVKGKK